MKRRRDGSRTVGGVRALSALVALLALIGIRALAQDDSSDGWQIPQDAARLTSSLTVDDKVLAKGKELYKGKCQKCHGVSGRGDGPDADPKHKPGNLTDGRRASRNPDGVMFYKVWNGRAKPKMPAFKSEMTRDEIWTVIAYVKTLRQ